MKAILSTIQLSKAQKIALDRYRSSAREVLRVFLDDRPAMLAALVLAFFSLLAIFAPVIAPYDPSREFLTAGQPVALQPPSMAHPFGTTTLARDVFSQWVYGSRISLLVGVLSGLSVMVIGTTVGIVAGYYKGMTDLVLMRVVDTLYGIPATPFILILVLFFGASVWNVILAMVLILWRTMARVIRSETLSLAERPFVKSARAAGASDKRIMFVHILPNLLPLIMVETTIVVAFSIALEAGISFLGLGATAVTSWGAMLELTFSSGAIRSAWWWVIPPGFSITLLVLSFFYISRIVEELSNPESGRFKL
ncbi:ABC transporter permease [Halorussus halobius]|uniref:ABC transporter permease n=1 Tax=Halorussus halobius TaxID=1710537 RepID=UPI001093073F|nr:ABC transporter permease [Halorussus halobius]